MKKLIKNQGITLIALITTIVILVVLAGVSLHLVAGDGGILRKTTVAVEENQRANDEEEIEMALDELRVAYYRNYSTSRKDTMKAYIKNCAKETIFTTNGQIELQEDKLVYSKKRSSKIC